MRNGRLLAVLAALAVCLLLAACGSRTELTFVAEGGSYSAAHLEPLLAAADLGKAARVTTSEAPDVRIEVLAQLRQQGDEAIALADTLTSDFPADVTAVPVAVEAATYDGEAAWIVIEAWGDEDGTLIHRRLWVFSKRDQSVLAALSQE